MSNKSAGSAFEREAAELLYDHGMWVHMITQSQEGQPADLIAVYKQEAFLIDCKVCGRGYFTTARVEDNQLYAMECWWQCGNLPPLFFLKYPQGIYVMPFTALFEDDTHTKLIPHSVRITPTGKKHELLTPLDMWLRIVR